MGKYYVKLYPYKDIVKYDNGEISTVNFALGGALNKEKLIEELIRSGKSYPEECLTIIKKIEFYLENYGRV